jgi:hypothetical protein
MPLHPLELGSHSHECTRRGCQTHERVVCGSGSEDFELAGNPRVSNPGRRVVQSYWWKSHGCKDVGMGDE